LIETDWEDLPEEHAPKRTYKQASWYDQAACLNMGVSKFFGAKDPATRPSITMKQIKSAKKICDQCPVFKECLTHALKEKEEYGIWAGTSGRTRSKIWAMVSDGEVTIEQVVLDYTHGRLSKYEGRSNAH
jgi:WhiB family transcriptional regulator, redox-sensing transcriptional regulator